MLTTQASLVLQEEGLQSFIGYLKDLILKRAEDDYTALVEGEQCAALRGAAIP